MLHVENPFYKYIENMPKYKPGQFISTTKGRMRVRKAKEGEICKECFFRKFDLPCSKFLGDKCVYLIGYCAYLEKV